MLNARGSTVASPWLAASLAVVLVTLVGFAAHARPRLSPENARRMEAWEVLAFSIATSDRGVRRAKAIGRIASPPEEVLHTFMDLGRYRHWLPRMKGSREVRRRGRQVWAVLETRLPWPARDAWVYIKVTHRAKPGRVYEVRWQLINGTMRQYSGHALIEPWNERARHCVITFSLLAEPKTRAPDSVVSRGVLRVAEVFVHRLRMRVKALRKFGKLPANLLQRYGRPGRPM